MIDTREKLLHIRSVMESCGYTRVEKTDREHWFVWFEYSFDRCRIYREIFQCSDGLTAYLAVRSLLRKTDVYCVAVCSPACASVVSYYGTKNLMREWTYYYGASCRIQ